MSGFVEKHLSITEKIHNLYEERIKSLKKENELLRECVAYYANKYSWYLHKDKLSEVRRSIEYDDTESFGVLTETGENFLEVLGGKRARQCLAKLEE